MEHYQNEIWKPIKGYEGKYEISNYGRIYSYPRCGTKGGYTCGYDDGLGYKRFDYLNKRVQILVYETFVGPVPKGYDVHHKNHIKTDNRVENLELLLSNEHRKMHLKNYKDKRIENIKKSSSKPIIQYTLDGEFVAEYPSIIEAARQNHIFYQGICACCKNKQKTAYGYVWKYKEAA